MREAIVYCSAHGFSTGQGVEIDLVGKLATVFFLFNKLHPLHSAGHLTLLTHSPCLLG